MDILDRYTVDEALSILAKDDNNKSTVDAISLRYSRYVNSRVDYKIHVIDDLTKKLEQSINILLDPYVKNEEELTVGKMYDLIEDTKRNLQELLDNHFTNLITRVWRPVMITDVTEILLLLNKIPEDTEEILTAKKIIIYYLQLHKEPEFKYDLMILGKHLDTFKLDIDQENKTIRVLEEDRIYIPVRD